MRLTTFLSCCYLLAGASAFADDTVGSIVLEGRGLATSAPEFVYFSVKITSICYESSQDAAAANAEVANRTLAVLNTFKKNERDKLTASGGANILQTETTQIGLESKTICELKWHAENFLNIEIANTKDLPDLQDQVLATVNAAGQLDPSVVAQTFAEIGRPEFHLYPETAKKLRESAQVMAFDDAKTQLTGLNAKCPFSNLRLVKVSPSEYSYLYKIAGERIPVHSTSTPVIPDEMEVQAILRMEWAFNPSASCQL